MEALKRPNLSYLQKKGLRKKIGEKTKKVSVCPYCGANNGRRTSNMQSFLEFAPR